MPPPTAVLLITPEPLTVKVMPAVDEALPRLPWVLYEPVISISPPVSDSATGEVKVLLPLRVSLPGRFW
ncbi:MAG: hypothetical protein QM755_18060 [Luteolibacter sp.]